MLYSVANFQSNVGLGIQCGMMLDGFPDAVTKQIETNQENLEKIKEVIASQSPDIIEGFFKEGKKTFEQKVDEISQFIFVFFAYRKTRGK